MKIYISRSKPFEGAKLSRSKLNAYRCTLLLLLGVKRLLLQRPTGDYTSNHLPHNFSFLEERQAFPERCLIIAREDNRGRKAHLAASAFRVYQAGVKRVHPRRGNTAVENFSLLGELHFSSLNRGWTRCTRGYTHTHTRITRGDSPARLIQPFISLLRPPPDFRITTGIRSLREKFIALIGHTDFTLRWWDAFDLVSRNNLTFDDGRWNRSTFRSNETKVLERDDLCYVLRIANLKEGNVKYKDELLCGIIGVIIGKTLLR